MVKYCSNRQKDKWGGTRACESVTRPCGCSIQQKNKQPCENGTPMWAFPSHGGKGILVIFVPKIPLFPSSLFSSNSFGSSLRGELLLGVPPSSSWN